MPSGKSVGWTIYAAGFVIWLFGYVTVGHASVFDWDVTTGSWISSFVPNLEAEVGLALMFASMISIYWRAVPKRSRGGLIKYPKLPWVRLFAFADKLVMRNRRTPSRQRTYIHLRARVDRLEDANSHFYNVINELCRRVSTLEKKSTLAKDDWTN
jgi:hypothetical protein